MNDVLNPKEAAEYLGVSVRLLQEWRARGVGPAFSKFGSRFVRYQRRDLDDWLEEVKKSGD